MCVLGGVSWFPFSQVVSLVKGPRPTQSLSIFSDLVPILSECSMLYTFFPPLYNYNQTWPFSFPSASLPFYSSFDDCFQQSIQPQNVTNQTCLFFSRWCPSNFVLLLLSSEPLPFVTCSLQLILSNLDPHPHLATAKSPHVIFIQRSI